MPLAPTPQVAAQTPAPLQMLPDPQAWPQVPQFWLSLLLLTQTPPQFLAPLEVGPQATWQLPLLQTKPLPQAAVQEAVAPTGPQWLGSLRVSTQPTAPPQSVSPALQVALQVPALQTWPAAQGAALQDAAEPAGPQWLGSLRVSMQPSAPQSVKPVLHVGLQEPDWQDWPEGQAVPQAPQLAGSVERFAQAVGFAVGQADSPPGQTSAQAGVPASTTQLWPMAQAAPTRVELGLVTPAQ